MEKLDVIDYEKRSVELDGAKRYDDDEWDIGSTYFSFATQCPHHRQSLFHTADDEWALLNYYPYHDVESTAILIQEKSAAEWLRLNGHALTQKQKELLGLIEDELI